MGLFDFEHDSDELISTEQLNNAELINRESFERLKNKNKSKEFRRTLFYVLLAVALIAVVLFACIVLFFKLQKLEIVGNEAVSSSDVISICGFSEDTNIFLIDTREMRRTLMKNYPYVKDIKITRTLPGTLTVTVIEEEPKWFAKIWDRWFVLSDDLKVMEQLGQNADTDELIKRGLKWIKLPEVDTAIAGRYVTFPKNNAYSYTVDFLHEIETIATFDEIEYINCSDRYHISVYSNDHRFQFILGDSADIEAKLRFIFAIIDKAEEVGENSIISFNAEYISPVILKKSDELFAYE